MPNQIDQPKIVSRRAELPKGIIDAKIHNVSRCKVSFRLEAWVRLTILCPETFSLTWEDVLVNVPRTRKHGSLRIRIVKVASAIAMSKSAILPEAAEYLKAA